MTEKEIFELEKDSYIPIHLHLAGIFRCVYGRSIKLFLLLVLFSVGLSAQTVTGTSGYPVIDLSALDPLNVVLTSVDAAERRTLMSKQEPSNSNYLGVGSGVSDISGTWNKKMSRKFQVMRADHIKKATDWASAYTACKEYNSEGTGAGLWRLPTQRELQMICVLHPQLIGKGGFEAFSANDYWSITEQGNNDAWFMSFAFFYRYLNFKKTEQRFFRCVQDL